MHSPRIGALLATAIIVCLVAPLPAQRLESKLPPGVEQHLDVVYAQYGQRQMHVDLFVPQQNGKTRPAIVVIHGGGWLKGDKTKFHPLAQALAARGYVTAAVEYRLGGEAKFPAAMHDCNTAVRWLRANAQKYGVDPKRIGAVGGSAGGHLVGLMAAAPHLKELQGEGGHPDQSSALTAAVVMAGPLELASGPVAEKSRKQPDASNSNKWLGKTIDEAPELYKLASPLTHISADMPPVLFLTGELDNPQRNFAAREKLRAAGVATAIQVYKDGKHGCWNRRPWFDPMVDDMDAFFSVHLKKAQPGATSSIDATDWGEIRRGADRIELHVDQRPTSGAVSLPRLNNPIGAVYLSGDKNKAPLRFKPEPSSWTVTLPESAESGSVVVVVTKGPPRVAQVPPVVSASEHGVTLAAHDGVAHGKMLRYEPQPHKNTIGYWVEEADWCEWHCYFEQPGKFDLHILQGCGTGQGGSRVAVSLGNQKIEFIVEDTGHFQNFKDRKIGAVEIDEPGLYTLQIRPIKKAAKAVMDIRQVRLVAASQ